MNIDNFLAIWFRRNISRTLSISIQNWGTLFPIDGATVLVQTAPAFVRRAHKKAGGPLDELIWLWEHNWYSSTDRLVLMVPYELQRPVLGLDTTPILMNVEPAGGIYGYSYVDRQELPGRTGSWGTMYTVSSTVGGFGKFVAHGAGTWQIPPIWAKSGRIGISQYTQNCFLSKDQNWVYSCFRGPFPSHW